MSLGGFSVPDGEGFVAAEPEDGVCFEIGDMHDDIDNELDILGIFALWLAAFLPTDEYEGFARECFDEGFEVLVGEVHIVAAVYDDETGASFGL